MRGYATLTGATPTSDRCCEAAAHSYCARCCQHLRVPGFVLARVGDTVSVWAQQPLPPGSQGSPLTS